MNLTVVLMLAIVCETVVSYLTTPIKELLSTPKPERDGVFYLAIITPYCSFVIGLAVGLLARVDLFKAYIPDAAPGLSLVLTAVLIGGGASMIYRIIKALKTWTDKIKGVTPVAPLPPVIQPPAPRALNAAENWDNR